MSRKTKVERREPNKTSALDPRPSTFDLVFALAFGLFLGLCLWKFGNPVVLDQKISAPASLADWIHDPWPIHWATWIFLPLAGIGAVFALKNKPRWPSPWLWLLPLAWFGWQIVSAVATDHVAPDLVPATLLHFAGCGAAYFLGALVLNQRSLLPWLLAGILAAFAFCLVRAVDQQVVEFPHTRNLLAEGEAAHWTNLPPEIFLRLKQDGVIITTNGTDIANPLVVKKLQNSRVMGTLVYPNALAGVILLLLPITLALASTKRIRPAIRAVTLALAAILGGLAFVWSGSKFGWLLALVVAAACLLRRPLPMRWKIGAVTGIMILGLGIFALRFHHYFATGATSASARMDYWRAAVEIAAHNPAVGTGPGTFQHPYSQIKAPEAEMTRLVHNDYLEQFCDSGLLGGILYAAWIALALVIVARRLWKTEDTVLFATVLGVSAWFIQGIAEFSLYIPALAWIAFTLLGFLISLASPRTNTERNG